MKTVQIPVTKLPMIYNISPLDAASLMGGENEVHLLHCRGGMVASGAYRQFAKQHYPLIVETVVQLLTHALVADADRAFSYATSLFRMQAGEPIKIEPLTSS